MNLAGALHENRGRPKHRQSWRNRKTPKQTWKTWIWKRANSSRNTKQPNVFRQLKNERMPTLKTRTMRPILSQKRSHHKNPNCNWLQNKRLQRRNKSLPSRTVKDNMRFMPQLPSFWKSHSKIKYEKNLTSIFETDVDDHWKNGI